MSSKVYFANVRTRSHTENKLSKIQRLCDAVGLADIIKKDQLTAVKLHFGEAGNDTVLNPTFVRQVVDKIKALGGKPFLTDTNTLYSGMRHNAVDHLHTAYSHGFVPSVVDAPVVIADGIYGKDEEDIPVNLKHFKKVHIARAIAEAPAMLVLSHFKGHQMAGFGGAIKNLAMGCGSVEGKKDQHGFNVLIDQEKCIGCAECVKVCPEKALKITKNDKGEKKAKIQVDACIGCFECITVCQNKAISPKEDMEGFMERITEYAYGAVKNKEGKVVYINFLLNVTPDCDCAPWSDSPLVPDLGILASTDPVALDKACHDLVTASYSIDPERPSCCHGDEKDTSHVDHKDCCKNHDPHLRGVDKFSARWTNTKGMIQLAYGAKIGMGSLEYELIELKPAEDTGGSMGHNAPAQPAKATKTEKKVAKTEKKAAKKK